MTRLNLAMKGNLATTAGMAEADAALDAAMATGAISAKEQEAYLKKLAVAEGIETATTEANTAAHVENAAALKLNSRAYAEIGTAVSEIAAGNFGRLRRTGAAFANQAGLFKKIFTPVGGAITATAVAAITLATAFAKGQGETTAYAKALAMTGDYAEVTTGQLQAMSQ